VRRRVVRRGVVVVLEVGVLVAFVALIGAFWIFIHALDATGRLADARSDIQQVRADLLAGRSAVADMRAAQHDAAAARSDTHDIVWNAVSWLPPIKTVRGITTAVDTLARGALPDVVRVGASLSPGRLRVAPNRIAIAPLVAAAPTMRAASAAAARARDEVASLPTGWIGPVSSARAKALSELTSLAGALDDVARVATAGPAMLGEHGIRRYFVGIQNNAEARGTGGLVAAYAIVSADHGTIRVVSHGSDLGLREQTFHASKPVVSLDADFEQEYGRFEPAQSWLTSNLSPHFPYAADIWAHLWHAETGQHIDGSFGVDPVGLADLLAATGPIFVPGYHGIFSSTNLTRFVESTQYAAFPGLDNLRRKAFLAAVGTAVLRRLLAGSDNAASITSALGRAAGSGHLQLWSARSDEQHEIAGTPIAGELPATTVPFASVTVVNAQASKLDYYLDRSLAYSAAACGAGRRQSTIVVTLTNTAPRRGLPDYVRLIELLSGRNLVERVPNERLYVYVHATEGATLETATVDGESLPVTSGVERGHPVFSFAITLQPGAPAVAVFHLSEPTAAGEAETQVQPLARPQQTFLHVPRCS
jgi:hypothetical protein